MTVRDTLLEDAPALSMLVDLVARERRYLASTSGYSPEATAAFLTQVQSANGVHVVAISDGNVVGWCDIVPSAYEGMKHAGRLGMGVQPASRGKGVGKKLLAEALKQSFSKGLEKVELEVFRSNQHAVRLYESFGFIREGAKIGGRKIDGISDDILLYAVFSQMPNKSVQPTPGSVTPRAIE